MRDLSHLGLGEKKKNLLLPGPPPATIPQPRRPPSLPRSLSLKRAHAVLFQRVGHPASCLRAMPSPMHAPRLARQPPATQQGRGGTSTSRRGSRRKKVLRKSKVRGKTSDMRTRRHQRTRCLTGRNPRLRAPCVISLLSRCRSRPPPPRSTRRERRAFPPW